MSRRKARGLLAVPAVLVALMPGCKNKTVALTPELAASDEALYKLGAAEIESDMEEGLLYLRQVIDSFPKSFYAQRAKLLIADAHFRKGRESDMIQAAAEYREFIRTYPYSPSAAYARYRIGMTFYTKMPRAGCDPSKAILARAEFIQVVSDYPASDEAGAARVRIRECEERLAAHNAEIGIFYHGRKAYRAAISRLTEVLSNYAEYSRLDRVYYYLGDSHFRLKRYAQAVPFFAKVVTDHPGSKLAPAAMRTLAEIEKLADIPENVKRFPGAVRLQ